MSTPEVSLDILEIAELAEMFELAGPDVEEVIGPVKKSKKRVKKSTKREILVLMHDLSERDRTAVKRQLCLWGAVRSGAIEKMGTVPLDTVVAALRDCATINRHLTKAVARDMNHVKAIMRSIQEHGGMPQETAEQIEKTLMQRVEITQFPRDENAKQIIAWVKKLPIYDWIQSVRGAGPINVGLIIGNTGNLSNYRSHYKVWKRMGLAVMDSGERQRKFTDPEMALMAGYSPARRSLVWQLGDCLLKQNYTDKEHSSPGPYRSLYETRLSIELAKFGATTETFDPKQKNHQHAKARAKRYMEKTFLKDLWRVWRDTDKGISEPHPVVSTESLETELQEALQQAGATTV